MHKSYPIIWLLLLSFNVTCIAQNTSRIVFYRSDITVFASLFGYDLYHNNKPIHKIWQHTTYIYNAPKCDGKYFMAPNSNHKLMVSAGTKSITFIRARMVPGLFHNAAYLKKVSLVDFRKYYNKKKWLREELALEGYKSEEELIDGFWVTD